MEVVSRRANTTGAAFRLAGFGTFIPAVAIRAVILFVDAAPVLIAVSVGAAISLTPAVRDTLPGIIEVISITAGVWRRVRHQRTTIGHTGFAVVSQVRARQAPLVVGLAAITVRRTTQVGDECGP
jgi:hypothetical protein